MNRTTSSSGASSTSFASMPKPVMAPHRAPVELAERQVFVRPLNESYDASGAPRLHYGLHAADAGNTLVQINTTISMMTPLLRPVFIPELPDNSSVMVEGRVDEPGIVILSYASDGSGGAVVQVIAAPSTRARDISQGDHNGLLQINPPTQGVLSTTFSVTPNALGDYEFATQSTSVTIANLAPSDTDRLTRMLQGQASDLMAAVVPDLLTHKAEFARSADTAGLGCLECCTKRACVLTLQIIGGLSTVAGATLALIGQSEGPEDGAGYTTAGIVLGGLGGLCRMGAALVNLPPAPAPPPAAAGGRGEPQGAGDGREEP